MPRNLLSVAAVARVQRLDGRSRIIAEYRNERSGWQRTTSRAFLTADSLAELQAAGVRTVELRRWLRRGRVPLAWFPGRVPVLEHSAA